MIRSVIRSQAIGIGRASNVIKKINPFIYRDTTSKMYATLWYGVLNCETKVLNYSIAGHNPAVIYNPVKRTFGLLKTGGMAVGVVDNDIFADSVESHAIQLEKGDILIQYTDGVTEAMNEVQDEYGEERFYECVKRLGDLPADKIVEEIVADIQKFTGGIEQSDDITMVVMKVEK
jgi:sigma-B regulation protein RsbU (phosphoserine phosphatase)